MVVQASNSNESKCRFSYDTSVPYANDLTVDISFDEFISLFYDYLIIMRNGGLTNTQKEMLEDCAKAVIN